MRCATNSKVQLRVTPRPSAGTQTGTLNVAVAPRKLGRS